MTDTADLDLVLARLLPKDTLDDRAKRHLKKQGRLLAPFSAGLESLLIAARRDFTCVEALGASEAHFDVGSATVLYTAAEALDAKEMPPVFDAVQLADALHRGGASTRRKTSFWLAPTPPPNSDPKEGEGFESGTA